MTILTQDVSTPLPATFAYLDLRPWKLAFTVLAVVSWFLIMKWHAASLIIIAIAVHEAGHVAAMKYYGIPTHGFWLIPLVGGCA